MRTHLSLPHRTLVSSQNSARPHRSAVCTQGSVDATTMSWTKATTMDALKAAGGRVVVDIGQQPVLIAEAEGRIFAVSNKCPHLGVPLHGKSPPFQGKIRDRCITCPAHKSTFDLETGALKGPWAPWFPPLPLVGKLNDEIRPLPTYESRVVGNDIEVLF